MLGKVIVHGPDRESARRALVAALDETAILGLTTNIGFLRALAASDEFRDATIDTAWLDQHDGRPAPDDELPRVFVAWVAGDAGRRRSDHGHPFQADGWRDGADPAPILVELDETVAVDRGPRHGSADTTVRPARGAEQPRRRVLLDRRPARAGRRQRAAAQRRGRAPRAPPRLRAARTCSPTTARSSATARSSRRCPAPCSPSTSRPGQRSPRARCSACWRR